MADKYDPIKLVGKGSFGSVYLVSRRRDGAQFVLKNMQIKNVPEKEIESYQNEVALLTALEHPGIVSHIESFIDGDKQHMCIVMGYCEGGDLAAYLKHKKNVPMREDEILCHFVQMALALMFMHEKNILHRDLKTQNIFVRKGLIQLGDFGISKELTGSTDFAQTCIGTPYYMSPELFQNKKYNHKSDVWALGCVLYEMITYKHAFDASSINGLAQKILQGKITAIDPKAYSKTLRTLVQSMLQLDPLKRPDIRSILQMPFLRKHLRTYANAVLGSSSGKGTGGEANYKVQDIINFKAQMKRLGMEDLLSPPAQPPSTNVAPPVAGIPVLALPSAGSAAGAGEKPTARASARAGVAPSSSSSAAAIQASAAAAQAAAAHREREKAALARHKEQSLRLQQLQAEEEQQRSLEEKLSKLKKAHEIKAREAMAAKSRASAQAQAQARPSSAVPTTARGTPSAGGAGSASSAAGSKAKALAPSASKAGLKRPSGSGSSAAAPSAGGAAGAAVSAFGKQRPPSAGGMPISSSAASNASGSSALPSHRGVAPSSSPPSNNGYDLPSSSSRPSSESHLRAERASTREERARRLASERAEHEQAVRLKEVEELRAAEQARLAEVERIEMRRRALELARKAKTDQAESSAAAVREREIERARIEEAARQKKVYLAQVEAEKAELERIRLEKAWIAKRLDDLAAAKPASSAGAHGNASAGASSGAAGKRNSGSSSSSSSSHARNLREDDSLPSSSSQSQSQRDRILAEKAQRRQEAEADEHARLQQGRAEAFRDRQKVVEMRKPHLQSALSPTTAPYGAPRETHHPPGGLRPHAHHQQQQQDEYDDDFESDDNNNLGHVPPPVVSASRPTVSRVISHSQSQQHSHRGDRDDFDEHDGSSSSEHDEEGAEEDLAQEAEAIEEAESLLLGLTKRIQDLRTSIEVPTVLEDAADPFDQDDDDEEAEEEEEDEYADEEEAEGEHDANVHRAGGVSSHHSSSSGAAASSHAPAPSSSPSSSSASSPPSSVSVVGDVKDRMKLLAKECAKLVGRAKFIDAFTFLQENLSSPLTPRSKMARLTQILGADKVHHWEKIDQIVFMDRSS